MAAQRRRSDKLLESEEQSAWRLDMSETIWIFNTTPARWRKSCHPPARLASEFEYSRPSSDKVCLYSETCADD